MGFNSDFGLPTDGFKISIRMAKMPQLRSSVFNSQTRTPFGCTDDFSYQNEDRDEKNDEYGIKSPSTSMLRQSQILFDGVGQCDITALVNQAIRRMK